MRDELIDALAVYRLTRLLTADKILDGPRNRFIAWADTRHDPTVLVCDACGIARPALVGPCPNCGSTQLQILGKPPADEQSMLGYLATCAWCTSVWIGAGAVIARRTMPRVWRPIAELLALSAAAGLIDDR